MIFIGINLTVHLWFWKKVLKSNLWIN